MTSVENLTDPVRIDKKLEPAELNVDKSELKPVSRLRQTIPQIYAVSAKNFLLIGIGTALGFPTILLPALQKENPDIPVTLNDLTWIGSITFFIGPLGCLVSGPISEFMGRKRSMLLSNLPFIVGWLLLYYATTPMMLYIPMALTGIVSGLVEGPILTYVSEITQPHLRGLLSATASMAAIIGVFIQLLAGSVTDWRNVALLNISFHVLCLIALSFVPESPYWLAGKGRVKEAEKALCFFRGWVSPCHVQEELRSITMAIKNPLDHKVNDDTTKEKFWKSYLRSSVIKPFVLVSLTFVGDSFGGSTTLQTYAVSIFERMNAPMDKYTATVWLGVAEIVGTLVCVLAIHFTGKRKITFFSISGTGFCFLGSAIYTYLLDHDIFDSEAWTWLPTTLLIGSAFLSHVGIKLLPWILIGEVFPATVRSGATGITASVGYICISVSNKIFLYMVNGIDISGTFSFYAVVNLLTGIMLYFILPETEGRTLQEIEEHYAGINNLKNKPTKNALPFKEQWTASNPIAVTDNTESRL